ncbi:MAG: hypothetical protein RLZZ623_831 [Actinomycetota bacterium]
MTDTHQPLGSQPLSPQRLDSETVDMLRSSLRHVLTASSDAPLGARLAELGWDDVVDQDASTALRMLFEMRGETLSTADALGPALGQHLLRLAGSSAVSLANVVVALPSPFGTSVADGAQLQVDAMLTSPGAERIALAVGGRLAVCSVAALSVDPIESLEHNAGWTRVHGTVAAADVMWADGIAWTDIVAHGRWLLACELVGIGRHVIAEAVEYTKQRVQYGKAIGSFQALQHRLAAAHSMVVGAGHLAREAGDDGDGWTALIAKCMAGQAAEFACTQAQQCYGAIGFTWEHEFHRYLRRTYTLDRLLGDWRSLEHEIGARLQQSGQVPRIGRL